LGEQLAQYLGTDDPALIDLIRNNPAAGMQFYNARREDRRFDRTAGQDDRRIATGEGQLALGWGELDERRRSNRAGENITVRGQDLTRDTQLTLRQMQQQSEALDRQFRAAMANRSHEQAKELLALKQQLDIEIAAMGGGDAGYEETVVETPGSKGGGGFLGIGGSDPTPSTKTVTRRPLQPAARAITSEAQYNALRSGELFIGPDGKQYRKP
jgi:hypothetical protein